MRRTAKPAIPRPLDIALLVVAAALLLHATPATGQPPIPPIAAQPLLPTEHAQCDRMHRENMATLGELGERSLTCVSSRCARDRQSGDHRWLRASRCPAGHTTCPSCLAVANDYCAFEDSMIAAIDTCHARVAAYRKLHELWSAEDGERAETEQFVRRLNDGVVDAGSRLLRRPADKLFAIAAEEARRAFGDARRQLNEAFDAWAMSGADADLPSEETIQGPGTELHDKFFALGVWTATWGQVRPEDERWSRAYAAQVLTPALLTLAGQGDARAAYLLGRLHEQTKGTDTLSYYLRSAALGYVPAAERVGAQLRQLGLTESGRGWLELAAKEGSRPAERTIAALGGGERPEPQRVPAPLAPVPGPTTPRDEVPSERTATRRGGKAPNTGGSIEFHCRKRTYGWRPRGQGLGSGWEAGWSDWYETEEIVRIDDGKLLIGSEGELNEVLQIRPGTTVRQPWDDGKGATTASLDGDELLIAQELSSRWNEDGPDIEWRCVALGGVELPK